MSLRTWTMIALALGSVAPALAQPSTAPPAPPVEVPPEPPPPPAPPSADTAETKAAYDRAFALLLTEQWDEAAAGFTAVVSDSVEAERRGAAAELARFAREMDARSDGGPKRSSGRASFVATTTLASFYAGFVIDDLLAVEDYKAQTLVVTGVTLGGFAASLFATGGKRITDSMASAYGSGLMVGAGNGLLLAPRLGIEPDGEAGDGEVNQIYLGFGLAAMAVGGAGAMYLADAYDPTPAQASYAGLMGVNGLITVGLGLVMLQPDLDYRNVLTLLALGLDGGVVAGAALGRDLTWSRSRITYVTLAEFLGGLTGGAAAIVTADEDTSGGEKLAAGLVLAGVWGGFALARHLTRGMAPDPRYRSSALVLSLVPTVSDQGGRGLALAGTF